MDQKALYRDLMERIKRCDQFWGIAWREAQSAALKEMWPHKSQFSWEEVMKANGVAYEAVRSRVNSRNELLRELFDGHLAPLDAALNAGDADAVHAVIDFLETDVLAFRCGYAKEDYMRRLKHIALNDHHRDRLRRYALSLCRNPQHRREIRQASRLVIHLADQAFINELRVLSQSDIEHVRLKSARMLNVVLNGNKRLV